MSQGRSTAALPATRTAAPPSPQPEARGFQRWVNSFTSLPCASEVLGAISRFNIGPVTELLDKAAFVPLRFRAPFAPHQTVSTSARQLALVTQQVPGGLSGRAEVGAEMAELSFCWAPVAEDYVGQPGQPSPLPLPLDPHRSQRFELRDLVVRFKTPQGAFLDETCRLYGTGRTFPWSDGSLRWACAIEILEGTGQLAGLLGTAVCSGRISGSQTSPSLDGDLLIRWMDPAGGLLTTYPLGQYPTPSTSSGSSTLAFMGEVDADHPVQLRFAPNARILGSNVYERLRTTTLEAGLSTSPSSASPRLQSYGQPGPVSGSVGARLSFNPLRCCSIGPIQTRRGVFEFHDSRGQPLGSIEANMVEGRSFRTELQGVLLPVFRFVGFGPIDRGSGIFAGATGMMTMSSVISVQPRTLSNLYVLELDANPQQNHAYGTQSLAAGGAA